MIAWEKSDSFSVEKALGYLAKRFPKYGTSWWGHLFVRDKIFGRILASNKMMVKHVIKIPGPSQAEALISAGGVIFAGGPADRHDRIKGKGKLWAFSLEDGKLLNKVELDARVVAEGLAAVEGKLFAATQDGKLVCFSEK